ncbi:hypothetical protein WDU94_010221 [Cyamophila willieti]
MRVLFGYSGWMTLSKEFVFLNRHSSPHNGVHYMDLLNPPAYKLHYPNDVKPQPRPDLDKVYTNMRKAYEDMEK